jgi:hypothetical protein
VISRAADAAQQRAQDVGEPVEPFNGKTEDPLRLFGLGPAPLLR